ncbi:MAG: hypothetical protein WCT05_12750 [Lentisphaeria bacterium]
MTVLIMMSLIFAIQAEMLLYPDDNTLWLEDGKNIKVSEIGNPEAWNCRLLSIQSLPEGGFSIGKTPELQGNSTYRNLPVSPEYPWLTFQITGFETLPGYRSWSFYPKVDGKMVFILGQITYPKLGIYNVHLYDHPLLSLPDSQALFLLYIYNLQLNFAYLKMVKKPDNYLELHSSAFSEKKQYGPGDILKFTMCLKNPAEDASIRFFDHYKINEARLNNNHFLQLKPEDDEQKIWSATVTVKSMAPVSPKKKHIAGGTILLKGIVLGGSLKVPVWGTINYPYYP